MNKIYLGVIEVTDRCNLHCKHCYGNFTGKESLDLKKFKIITERLREKGVEIINITGGEPLLLGDRLLDYTVILREEGVREIRLLTNGILIEKMKDSFFNAWDRIQVSIDGLEKKHDYIRGQGTFKKAFRGIRKLKSLHKKVDIMMTVNRDNFDDYKDLYKLCGDEGLNFAIEIYTSTRADNQIDMVTKEQYREVIEFCVAKDIHCNDPIVNVIDKTKRKILMERREISGCLAGISALVVDVEGNVFPCPRIREKISNIFEDNWKNILLKSDFVKKNIQRDLSGNCGRCRYKYICGGCRALSYSLTNNVMGGNPYCFLKNAG